MEKIIFVDIDGTIIDIVNGLKTVSEKTRYAFEELKKHHYVFIASGRSKCMLPDDILALKPSGYLLANGAYAEIDDKIIIDEKFQTEDLNYFLEIADGDNYVAYLESKNYIYTKGLNSPLDKAFKANWKTPDVYRDINELKDENINVVMLAAKDENKAQDLEKRLGKIARRHAGFTSYDIDLENISKGSAIKKILDYLNVDIQDAYAFGDGINDIEMMQAVKHSIAMGNAFKEIKKVASEITEDCIDDGFYKALVRHGLIRALN